MHAAQAAAADARHGTRKSGADGHPANTLGERQRQQYLGHFNIELLGHDLGPP
jgi:hypothetical protein